jgi:hypothetical protein
MSFIEPPSHLDDTSPIRTIRGNLLPAWRRTVGIISLLLAALLTVGAALLILLPQEDTFLPQPTSISQKAGQPTQDHPPTNVAPE